MTLPDGKVVSDEIAATPPAHRVLAALVTVIAVAMSRSAVAIGMSSSSQAGSGNGAAFPRAMARALSAI